MHEPAEVDLRLLSQASFGLSSRKFSGGLKQPPARGNEQSHRAVPVSPDRSIAAPTPARTLPAAAALGLLLLIGP